MSSFFSSNPLGGLGPGITGIQEGPAQAQVTVGVVTADDTDGAYLDNRGGPYTDCLIYNRYERDNRIYMLPVARAGLQTRTLGTTSLVPADGSVVGSTPLGPGIGLANTAEGSFTSVPVGPTEQDRVAFVQLAQPTLLWISEWTICRYGVQPEFPSPLIDDDQWVLLDEFYKPVVLALAPDGVTPLYRLEGYFVYGHRNPSSSTIAQINYSRPPWMEDRFQRRVLSTSAIPLLHTVGDSSVMRTP